MPEEILSPRQVGEMFERFDTGKYTQVELASWFGCSQQLISKLLKEREDGRDRSKEGAVIPEEDAENYVAVREIERTIGFISKVVGDLWRKPVRTEKDWKELNAAKGSMKAMFDARKQLKELPKDLKEGAAKVDDAAMEELVGMVLPEHRRRFAEILKGLAQSRGQPSPDLDDGGKT